jgi:SAM-dependent methyltransferase
LGVSDRYYFDWLVGALDRFEAERGLLAALSRERRAPDLWCLAETKLTPAVERLRDALGREPVAVRFFDKFSGAPGVERVDLNALDALPDNACDVLTLFRASYFIADPPRTLDQFRRILRPGGLAVVDWLHGCSDAPVLDFPLDPRCGGTPSPLLTTYVDPHLLAEFPAEFEAFIGHVNRPPRHVNLDRPGTPLPLAEQVRRLVTRAPSRHVSRAGYVDTLRDDLARAGKHLVEPALLEQFFKVVCRDARYLYRDTGKFNLYLLTVLQPVGK